MKKRLPPLRVLKNIRFLFVDVDGVLTDGSITYSAAGDEVSVFSVKDGWGIVDARARGLEVGIITGRTSPIVVRRALDLGITEVHQGSQDKVEVLNRFLGRTGLQAREVAYIGDDIPDLGVLEAVGFSAAPSDAMNVVKNAVMYVCKNGGGNGAVREVIDLLFSFRRKGQGRRK